jgi:hypothetical protein
MKNKIIGKVINEFAAERNDLPEYFGDKIYAGNCYYLSSYNPHKTIKGAFLAQKYKSILEVIETTKAKVSIQEDCIYIKYENGSAKIGRDILIDTFLIPLLNN